MKKELKNKIVEVTSFLACAGVLLGIAYYTGFLKGFTVQDFKNAYEKAGAGVTQNISVTADKSGISNKIKTTRRISSYKGYQPMLIPDAVYRGVESSKIFNELFYSNKKVVFYIYDNSQTEFHKSVSSYLSTKSKKKKYNLSVYEEYRFNNMRLGTIGPSKICDSIEECNAVRQKASDYSYLTEFLKICGRTMCVFNPAEKQYIRLNNKNSGQAVKLINDLEDW